MKSLAVCAFSIACIVAGSVHGRSIPSGGQAIEFERNFSDWGLQGSRARTVELDTVKVSGESFRKAHQLVLSERTADVHEIMFQKGGRITGQIQQGDVLLCSFYARCTESTDESEMGKFTLNCRAIHPSKWIFPFTKTYTVDSKWKQFLIPFEAPLDNEQGYDFSFQLGGVKAQTLELADLKVVNYGNKKTLADLPITETRYAGIEPDAPWRKAAQERINQHRKEVLSVQVMDRNGNPVPDVKVHMELKNHAYGFGVALGLNTMFSEREPDNAQIYRDKVEELFNRVVFENRMKWKFHKDNDQQLETAIAWLAERNIPVRGHVMVWPDWQRLPRGMKEEYAGRDDEFRIVIEEHVRKMATAYPDTFFEWDIVNELYSQHTFVDMYGKEVVVDWFKIAKEANPNFKSYINDYGILAGNTKKHQDNYYEWIGYLLEQGAPLEGIGLQGHFRAPVPPEEILRRLDRFAEFGLPMQITEYDFDETDELLQARFTRDFMTVFFSHPLTEGIITWGLWEPVASCPTSAFFSKDWKKRRIAQAWEYMIKKEWHTDAVLRTNADGLAWTRGFLGDYEITISQGGRKKTAPYTLKKGAETIRVQW